MAEQVNLTTGEVPMPVNKLSGYNAVGEEIPDSKPTALNINFTRPRPLGERIRQLVHNELLARELNDREVETFDEADDFNVPDDPPDPATPFEESFDPLHTTSREQEIRSGFVQERPKGQADAAKAKAREIIDKHRKAPPPPPPPTSAVVPK